MHVCIDLIYREQGQINLSARALHSVLIAVGSFGWFYYYVTNNYMENKIKVGSIATTEEILNDLPTLREVLTSKLSDKYFKMLEENNLNPLDYQAEIEIENPFLKPEHDGKIKVTVFAKIKPVFIAPND